jgi:hypothetical protein
VNPTAVEAFARAVATMAAEIAAELLAEKSAAERPSQPAEHASLVDIDGLAKALDISVSTVRRMVREGCPHEFYGSAPRFDVAAVRAWARERGKKAVAHEQPRRPSADPIPGVVLKTRKGRG